MSADSGVVMRGGPARELILVRHGQSTWNREHLFTGQADAPLTDIGRGQATELMRACQELGITAVASSDLVRAHETGAIVSAGLGLSEAVPLADLRERWSRTLTGMTQEEIEAVHPGSLAAWRDGPTTELPGDSEAFPDFTTRVVRGLHAAASLGTVVLVVGHAGLFRILGQVSGSGCSAGVANTGGRRITLVPGGLVDAGDPFVSSTEPSSRDEDPPGRPRTGARDV